MADVELDGVTKCFDGVTAVDNVSLHVPDGDLLVLLGPSGCGKTTLLRTIAGLDDPTDGEVYLGGTRITDLPARKRDVSLVFQDFALFPHLSARENLSFNLRMQGADDVDRRVEETAELLDVADLLDRSIDELSGGQKQRIALGRAIVTEPAAFLLDEPLANLDANLRERMQTEIVRLQERLGNTTIHVTHDQEEALTMGDRVAVMRDGRIEQVGTPESVYRAPASLFVARFVGTMNLVRGRLDGGDFVVGGDGAAVESGVDGASVEVGVDGGQIRLSIPDVDPGTNRDVVLGIRPEHVRLSAERPTGEGWVDAQVQFDEFQGADRFVHVDARGLSEVVSRQPADETYVTGEDIQVSFPPEHVHLFDSDSCERLGGGVDPGENQLPGRRPR